MQFIEVEDIKTIKASGAPKTQDQLDRENYEEVVEKDKNEVYVTDEQRKKTIKCLLKVLEYKLEGVQEQADDINDHYKKVDKDIKDLEDVLKKEENKIIMDEVKFKMALANKASKEYQELQD